MASASIETLVKMMKSVPEPLQDQVIERMREHLAEVLDDLQWEETIAKSQDQLERKELRSKEEAAPGDATEMPSSIESKLAQIEALWDEVSTDPSNLPVPKWHLSELEQRERYLKENPESGRNWDEVERELRSRYER